jgi:hypothetical protein
MNNSMNKQYQGHEKVIDIDADDVVGRDQGTGADHNQYIDRYHPGC